MTNIFDHVIAVVPYFHLELFELPSSSDLIKMIINTNEQNKKGEH